MCTIVKSCPCFKRFVSERPNTIFSKRDISACPAPPESCVPVSANRSRKKICALIRAAKRARAYPSRSDLTQQKGIHMCTRVEGNNLSSSFELQPLPDRVLSLSYFSFSSDFVYTSFTLNLLHKYFCFNLCQYKGKYLEQISSKKNKTRFGQIS